MLISERVNEVGLTRLRKTIARFPLSTSNASALAIALSLAVLTLLVRLSVGWQPIDDPYITFRYARNIADGLGFVYNPGQHVIGTTTPLFTLILAAFYRLGVHNLPALAPFLASLADVGTATVLFFIGRRLWSSNPWATLPAMLFSFCAVSILYTAAGMEVALFAFLVVAAAGADLYERPTLAAALAGLSALTRPEGLLMISLVLGRHLLRRQLPSWRAAVASLAPVLAWSIFSLYWTGTVVPQSLRAKAATYIGENQALENLRWVVSAVGWPGMNIQYGYGSGSKIALAEPLRLIHVLLALTVLMASVLLMPRLTRLLLARPQLVPLVLFGPLLSLLIVVAGFSGTGLFPWYLLPLLPFYLLGIVAAVKTAGSRLRRPVQLLIALLVLAWTLLGLNLGRQSSLPALQAVGTFPPPVVYTHIARFLEPKVHPKKTVVALDTIGDFGYYSRADILDSLGLVSPQALTFLPSKADVPLGLIKKENPDFVITWDQIPPTRIPADAPWFQRRYILLRAFPNPPKSLLVYQRRSRQRA